MANAPFMSIQINQADWRQVKTLLARIPKGLPRVATRALNRVAARAKTGTKKRLAGELRIAQKHITPGIWVQKASYRRLLSAIYLSRKRLSLMVFRAAQTPAGVMTKWAKKPTIPGAFIATMPSGRTDVYRRAESGGRMVARLPIKTQRGPSLAEAFSDAPQIAAAEARIAAQNLPKELMSYADHELKKAGFR